MSTYKTTAEQISDIEEKRKKLTRQLQELKRREEQRNAVKLRRIGKILIDDFSDLSVDEVPDNDEEAAELVNRILEGAASKDSVNIEQVLRSYTMTHAFALTRWGEDGEKYAERIKFEDLLTDEGDGKFRPIDFAELAARYS